MIYTLGKDFFPCPICETILFRQSKKACSHKIFETNSSFHVK